jgi:O-antigen/teichoic acid export membrane protein
VRMEQRVPSPGNSVSSEIKKLFQHSSHYFAGLMGKVGLGFISLPIFTRVFSVSDYGIIDFAGKMLLLLTALSKMGLQNSALRLFDGKAFASRHEDASRYYSTMFFGALFTSLLVGLMFLGVCESVLKPRLPSYVLTIVGFVAAMTVVRAIQSMLWSFMRIEERTKAYNISMVVSKMAMIATICLLLPWIGRAAKTYFSGAMIAELALALVLTTILARRGALNVFQFDFRLFSAGLLFGAPLIFYEISTIVLDAGDRVLVAHYLGATPLGIYSVAYGLSAQMNDLLIVPLNLALFPIYMRLWTSKGQQATADFLGTCLDMFILVAAGVCAVIAVAARDGVILLASSKYAGAEPLIPIIVVGLLIYTTHVFLCAGLLIHKKTGTMAALLFCSAGVNIGLNCILLPRMGLIGAAIATLVSYAFCILLLAWASNRYLSLPIRFGSICKCTLSAILVAFAAAQIELKPLLLNLSVRSIIAAALYCGMLYVLEPRIRVFIRRKVEHRTAFQRENTWKCQISAPDTGRSS